MPSRLCSSPVGRRRSTPKAVPCFPPLKVCLKPNRHVAQPGCLAERRKDAPIADTRRRWLERNAFRGLVVPMRRTWASDVTIEVGADDGNDHRYVEVIGDAIAHKPCRASDPRIDAVERRHDILAAAEQLRIVMREHRGNGVEIDALDRIEREPLHREADSDAVQPNRFRALGQDRTESAASSA